MNDVVTTSQPAAGSNPFGGRNLAGHVNAGAVSIEQERAIAEAQGKLVIAKRFPRDQAAAYQRVMDACSRPGLAEEALYSYRRGGQDVTGPSIRLAEEIARCWGNVDYGMRELSRRFGESELEAYAWDLETNTSSSQKFTVKHAIDTKNGRKDLTDERDIYEIGANMGARRMRARILAILPADLVDAAVARVRLTLKGQSEQPIEDRIRALLEAFASLGVQPAMIEQRIGKSVSNLLPDEMVDLRAIYKTIRDGAGKASDYFGAPPPTGEHEPPKKPTAADRMAAAAPQDEPPVGAGTSPEHDDAF